MNAKKVCEAQNAFGRFMQLYNLGQVQLATPLFCSSPQVSLWLPDYDISAIGPEAVAAALKNFLTAGGPPVTAVMSMFRILRCTGCLRTAQP